MKALSLLLLLIYLVRPYSVLGQVKPNSSLESVHIYPPATTVLLIDDKPEILPIYFLLGTLSDYMGRFKYVARQNQVDSYYPYEKPLVNYLTKYIAQHLQIRVDTSFEKSGHGRMDSPELAKRLNTYYNRRGLLADSLFTTDAQINSFLLGNYFRYGRKLSEKVYKIQLANTLKAHLLGLQLQRAGCDRVLYKFLHNIPAQTIFYFTPSPKLLSYFNLIELENVKLHNSFTNSVFQQVYKNQPKEAADMRAVIEKGEAAEAKTIEDAFK
jgi:hypothetical protein